MGKAIALATPFFFVLMAIEAWVARRRGLTGAYRLNDSINSLSLGVLSQVTNLFVRVLTIGIYAWAFEHVALGRWPDDQWWAWLLAIVFYDFCYYWNHRIGHESAVFWASHVVHHQSQRYNLTTALRQTSSGALLGWIFYLPMAVAGVPPQMFAVAAIVDLLYQFWIHTETVGKLGWYDRWFASPSNHRVHHAVNDGYIDRNYGGIFMAWDRLFGTFVEEKEPCVYGTRSPLDSWDPLWANLEVYADLARKSWRAGRWRDKLLVWFMPPGWQPVMPAATAASGAMPSFSMTTGPMSTSAVTSGAMPSSTVTMEGTSVPKGTVTARAFAPKPAFDLANMRTYDPPMSRAVRTFALVHLVLAIVATTPLLWYAETMPRFDLAIGAIGIVVVLWVTGAVMQGRLRLRAALLLEGAFAIAALLAVTVAAT